jgi:cytochrome P450
MTSDTAATGCPVRSDFDPLSAEYLADPFAILATLPYDQMPIFYAPSIGYYVVARYADIERVFRDPMTFSAAAAQLPLVELTPEAAKILRVGGYTPQPTMVSLDEAAHARLRRPAARAFTVKRVNDMAPTIRATTRELLDAVGDASEFDLIAALAFPLPAYTIFSLMGVPKRDWAQLKDWCRTRAALAWGRPAPDEQVELARGVADYRAYVRELVAAKVTARGDDLASDLLAIHDEDPGRLSHEEVASILFSLSFAGHETTTNLIGNTVRRMLEDPMRWQRLVADRGLIPAAVEETLRFDTSVPVWRRITTRPVTLGGVDLPEGAKLFLWLAAAGRDPAIFNDPNHFDLGRSNANEHLAFGRGVHYCLGASLGKLETRLVLDELTTRFPDLRLVAGQRIPFHPNISFRGPQRLLVRRCVSSSNR